MREAWGLWGADDEIGALNRVGADQVRTASALVKEGKVFSLSQTISSKLPVPPHRIGVAHFMNRDAGDYPEPRPGFQFADDSILMALHSGTHIDALCHCWYDGQLYNGFDAREVRSSGTRRLGAEKLPPVVTRGVLLDFVRLTGGTLPDGHAIDAGMVRDCLAASDLALAEGDAVLLRTGWLERQPVTGLLDFDAEPGIDVSAAELLAAAGVVLVGADNFAIEAMPFSGPVFPVHQRLIRDYGIPLLEGAVLRPLGEAGATEFLFVAAALPIKGGTGSPIHPLAIL